MPVRNRPWYTSTNLTLTWCICANVMLTYLPLHTFQLQRKNNPRDFVVDKWPTSHILICEKFLDNYHPILSIIGTTKKFIPYFEKLKSISSCLIANSMFTSQKLDCCIHGFPTLRIFIISPFLLSFSSLSSLIP